MALLEREKAFTRERDALSRERRALPWAEITKSYDFETETGRRTLAQLFGNALTDMAIPITKGMSQADGSIRPEAVMDVGNVASSVWHMAELPLDANVQFITVMVTAMPYIGRG